MLDDARQPGPPVRLLLTGLLTLLLLVSLGGLFFLVYLMLGESVEDARWTRLAAAGAGCAVLSWLLLRWLTLCTQERVLGGDLPSAVKELEVRTSDLEGVRREYRKMKMDLEEIHRAVLEEARELLGDQARLRLLEEDLISARQRSAQEQSELGKWKREAMEFHVELHDSLPLEGVAGLESHYRKRLRVLGIDAITPGPGEAFDDEVHHGIREEPAEAMSRGRIVRCLRPGYRQGATVIQKANVVLSSGQPPLNEPMQAEALTSGTEGNQQASRREP